jgi:hypothetical protein
VSAAARTNFKESTVKKHTRSLRLNRETLQFLDVDSRALCTPRGGIYSIATCGQPCSVVCSDVQTCMGSCVRGGCGTENTL